METEESNRYSSHCKTLITQDESLNKSFPPHWSSPVQACHNSGSTATPYVNSYTAELCPHPNMWTNQKYGITVQYETQHNNRSLSSRLVVPDGGALTISEREQSSFNEKEIDSGTLGDGKSGENGNGSSMPVSARDRPSCVSIDEGYGIDDSNKNEIFLRKQRCDTGLANGDATEKEATDTEKFNNADVNKNSASEDIAVDSAELNANLGNNVTEAKPRLSKLEEDEIRRERKRQLNRESARRSRIRKQQELEELQNTVDNLIRENSDLTKKLMRLSKDCMEISYSNNSIERELIEEYGSDIIADLVATKPAIVASGESPEIAKEATDQIPSTDVTGQF